MYGQFKDAVNGEKKKNKTNRKKDILAGRRDEIGRKFVVTVL